MRHQLSFKRDIKWNCKIHPSIFSIFCSSWQNFYLKIFTLHMFISLDHHCYPVPDVLEWVTIFCCCICKRCLSCGICLQPPSWALPEANPLIYIWITNLHFYLSHIAHCHFLLTDSLTPYSAAFSSSSLSKFKLLCIKSQTVTWQLVELLSSLGMMCVSALQSSETRRPKAAL